MPANALSNNDTDGSADTPTHTCACADTAGLMVRDGLHDSFDHFTTGPP